jgi:hypothetical protein
VNAAPNQTQMQPEDLTLSQKQMINHSSQRTADGDALAPPSINPDAIAMTLPMVMPDPLSSVRVQHAGPVQTADVDAVTCSLENPESCEACQ